MIFSQDRQTMRRFFYEVWVKYRTQTALDPLERLVADIIVQHSEYHALLEKKDAVDNDYPPELGASNPFLHMGMHIAIREQVATDRPAGIAAIYQTLLARLNDPPAVEHQMFECLGEALWRSQRYGAAPDEQAYMECLQSLAQRI
jgi:hypothetical protein